MHSGLTPELKGLKLDEMIASYSSRVKQTNSLITNDVVPVKLEDKFDEINQDIEEQKHHKQPLTIESNESHDESVPIEENETKPNLL